MSLQIPWNKRELAWDLGGYLLLLVHLTFILAYWEFLPDSVPIHFGIRGTPDGWGPRSFLILIPTVAAVLTIGLGYVARNPQLFNSPWPLNAANDISIRRVTRLLILRVRVLTSLLFALITATSTSVALEVRGGLDWWMVPMILLGIFGSIADYFVQGRALSR